MLKNFINEKYLSEKNINILKNNYIQANPFNYLEINDFFKSDILNQVLKISQT